MIVFLLILVFVVIFEEVSKAVGVFGFVLLMVNLGGVGMFVGIVMLIIVVEIYWVIDKFKFKIIMFDNVLFVVVCLFELLILMLIVMLLIGSIIYYLGFDWYIFVGNLVGLLV